MAGTSFYCRHCEKISPSFISRYSKSIYKNGGWHLFFTGTFSSLANDAGIAGRELGSLQGAISHLDGVLFETEALQALGITAANDFNMTTQTTKGIVSTVPDLSPRLMRGIGDIKNVKNIDMTSQLRAQTTIANVEQIPFTLIIGPKTETIAKSLQDAVRDSNGTIAEFNPVTGLFSPVTIPSNSIHIVRN